MLRANLNSNNSLSSSINALIFEATGVKEIVKDTVVIPAMQEALAESYQERLAKEVSHDALWGPIAQSFNVQIPNTKTVIVTSGESRIAEALEFGTPDNPPRPVIRPYQESFRQDLMINIDNVNKSIDI